VRLDHLDSLLSLLCAAAERRPLFVVSGMLPGGLWRVTYHAGEGVANAVIARALLEADGAAITSVRRAAAADVDVAFLSWRDDPHHALLKREYPSGASWVTQAALVQSLPFVWALRDTPGVRAALNAFARHDELEWRFRGVRVLPRAGGLLAYAADDAALRALLRPLLLLEPDAVPKPANDPGDRAGIEAAQPARRGRRRVRHNE